MRSSGALLVLATACTLLNLRSGSVEAQSTGIPAERYQLPRLASAWPGLQQFLRQVHVDLGTPLISNGIFYASPLLDGIDRAAARAKRRGTVHELRNRPTTGPDGGHLYTWVYTIPGRRALATADIPVCYEAVGLARGMGRIKPDGSFEPRPLPAPDLTCTQAIMSLVQDP